MFFFAPHPQVARKKSKRQKRAAKKAEEDFLYKVILLLEKSPIKNQIIMNYNIYHNYENFVPPELDYICSELETPVGDLEGIVVLCFWARQKHS